tara:strand:- start:147 stop:326 length:180 start_codon:yes stop_codon:yes gene_type:complete
MAVKIKQKNWSNAQRFGRLERVVSQLFVAVADLEKRVAKLDGGIETNKDEQKSDNKESK